jgi:hypothetical protein
VNKASALVLAAAIAASGVLAACGGDSSAPPPAPAGTPPAGAPAAAPAAAPAGGGSAFDESKATATIKIKATLKGAPPAMRPIKFDSDAECAKQHTAAVPDEAIVAADGKLANVMAWVSKGAEKWTYKTPTTPVVLDQKGCMYLPHVFTVQVNQPITIRNSDGTMHNIHAVPKKNDEFNKSQSKGAADLSEKFAKEEAPIKIKCDVHSWMLSWAGAFSHPFHGVTGADGTVSIKVPAGEFEVSAWHEYDKFTKPAAQTVKVADGETKEVEFVYELK